MPAKAPEPEDMRLNRFLARAGLGSRRGVEDLIREGRVQVDGETVLDLGRRVTPGRTEVTVDTCPITLPVGWRVFMFHKPRGVVSTLTPQDDRPCLSVYRDRADLPPGAIPVGRLDADTSGLLLWTDDGELAQRLCRPAGEVWKTYEVRLDSPLPTAVEHRLRDGSIEMDGRSCLPADMRCAGGDGRDWILRIREGRNRQVRRMFEAVGRRVIDLHRRRYGPLALANLPPGAFRELTDREIASLRDAVRRAAEEA